MEWINYLHMVLICNLLLSSGLPSRSFFNDKNLASSIYKLNATSTHSSGSNVKGNRSKVNVGRFIKYAQSHDDEFRNKNIPINGQGKGTSSELDGRACTLVRHVSVANKNNVAKIVGGAEASEGEFPYQVSIQYVEIINYEHICGGAVVSERFTLTAASCVEGFSVSSLQVVAGDYALSTTSGFEQIRNVVQVIVHPGYQYTTIPVDDIAILELDQSLQFGSSVANVPLPLEVAPEGAPCEITGWGSTVEGGQFADVLQKLTVVVLSDTECSANYDENELKPESMICASDTASGGEFCQGDEGSPLVCSGYLQGLASWGTGCNAACPGVYTEVFNYNDWILSVIQ